MSISQVLETITEFVEMKLSDKPPQKP
jgi:hypothetical protein